LALNDSPKRAIDELRRLAALASTALGFGHARSSSPRGSCYVKVP
jgi:hypothetical protein